MTRANVFLVGLAILAATSIATGQSVPDRISYQGQLNDQNGIPVNGAVTFTFALYLEDAGGAPLWSESQSILVSNGVFNVELGAATPLPSALFLEPALFLGIQAGADQEMIPRQQIVSGAFAQTAGTAESLLEHSVWPKHAGRDSSIVSYYGQVGPDGTFDLGVIPIDKTFIITDIKCSCDASVARIALMYNTGSGDIRVYYREKYGTFSGAHGNLNDSFESGIPIPGGATLKYKNYTTQLEYCTVAGYVIPAS